MTMHTSIASMSRDVAMKNFGERVSIHFCCIFCIFRLLEQQTTHFRGLNPKTP